MALTGVGGYIGSRLVERFEADGSIDRVLGFDLRPPSVQSSKLLFDAIDVRSDALGSRLNGVDVVLHLAFIMDPIKDERQMRDVNVNGSLNVFDAAATAGVRKIVYLSSAVAYGAHPDNDVPLTEESPLRANLDFSYAAHKLEVEYAIKEFRREHPDVVFTVFRPSIVFGRHVDNAWSHFLETPLLFGVRGHTPPFQFVHENDVTDALAFAVSEDLDGPFNLGAPDSVPYGRIVELLGKRRLELAEHKAFALMERLWSMGLAESPAGLLHYVMYPWVVSTQKLSAAGFTARHGSEEALRETLERTSDFVRFGRNRLERRHLMTATAAGVGLAGAALAARRARGAGRRSA